MEFSILSIPVNTPEWDSPIWNFKDEHAVEIGLSSGELRQSLLDRLREEVTIGNYSIINSCLENYGFTIKPELVTNKEIIVTDIEDVLYNISDEALAGNIWIMHNEAIQILGED